MGSDNIAICDEIHAFKFQSTLPVWGATSFARSRLHSNDISIHAPRVGSDNIIFNLYLLERFISIHAPRVGSDSTLQDQKASDSDFNPRSPCGERPCCDRFISPIHKNFNPRSPCGERLSSILLRALQSKSFQSTLPVWGATSERVSSAARASISIHAPRVGSDDGHYAKRYPEQRFQSTLPVWGATPTWNARLPNLKNFNPRSPCGERPDLIVRPDGGVYFNPRSPCGERLYDPLPKAEMPAISIHAPRVGSDSSGMSTSTPSRGFQSTLPVGGATELCQHL